MTTASHGADEVAIRALVQNWARAVRAKDYEGVLAHHAPGMLMFDVPPPPESRGLHAYRETWDLFFAAAPDPVVFEIREMVVVAGADVAWVAALMRCAEPGANDAWQPLDFRLTIGLRKVDEAWTILHEHHSLPAT